MRAVTAPVRRARVARMALAVVTVVALAAGCTGGSAPGAGVPDEALGPWALVAGSVDGQALRVAPGISMEVAREGEGWAANGVSACNSYFTSFVVEDDRLVASPVGSTMMACMPEGVMELEALHLGALQRVTAIVVVAGRLEATGDGVLLVFERAG